MAEPLDVDREALSRFCQNNHIRKLAFFGSVVSGDSGPGSDVDVLVWFDEDHIPGFFGLIEMEDELTDVLAVEDVDLHTPNDLSRHFRDEVLEQAEVQYASA